jgi:hypothetical protein
MPLHTQTQLQCGHTASSTGSHPPALPGLYHNQVGALFLDLVPVAGAYQCPSGQLPGRGFAQTMVQVGGHVF